MAQHAQSHVHMTHSVPIPLPEELALGLLGRFARLNGISSIVHSSRSLRVVQSNGNDKPILWLLAAACDQSEAVFSSRHSMLPVIYPISKYSDGTRDRDVALWHAVKSGLSIPAAQLRWCPECHRGDVEERGYSHWRRHHQLAGVDWCADHQFSLNCAPLEAVIHAPGHPATCGHNSVPPAIFEQEFQHSALAKLQQVMVGWLQRPKPVRLAAWTEVVGTRCREAGLRMGEVGKRPVVSDLICKMFPASWLARHIPEVATKEPRTFVRKIDGACIDKHVAYPALACAAILTALFESAQQALEELDKADRLIAAQASRNNSSGEALTAFIAGLSLRDACKKSGVSLASVEAALRQGLQHQLRSKDAQSALIAAKSCVV